MTVTKDLDTDMWESGDSQQVGHCTQAVPTGLITWFWVQAHSWSVYMLVGLRERSKSTHLYKGHLCVKKNPCKLTSGNGGEAGAQTPISIGGSILANQRDTLSLFVLDWATTAAFAEFPVVAGVDRLFVIAGIDTSWSGTCQCNLWSWPAPMVWFPSCLRSVFSSHINLHQTDSSGPLDIAASQVWTLSAVYQVWYHSHRSGTRVSSHVLWTVSVILEKYFEVGSFIPPAINTILWDNTTVSTMLPSVYSW